MGVRTLRKTFVKVFFNQKGEVCRVEVHGPDGQWWGSTGKHFASDTVFTYKPVTSHRKGTT
jgi:hypothetical protein